MATRPTLVDIELPDGQTILAEVSDRGVSDVGLAQTLKLDQVGDALSSFCHWAFGAAQAKLPSSPDRIAIEVGLKLTVKNGKLVGVIAEASAEATMVLKLEWQ